MLPELFLDRIEEILGDEYVDFLDCYSRPGTLSLRVNLLKGRAEALAGKVDFLCEPVPWASGGYYYKEGSRPGKHPFHEAGVYYIQEASAMAPASYLDARPGERVLDLCASPGGKSTQIAADMQGEGVLVCNEIYPQRAKVLSENIERMGVCNALVTNHEPAFLAERFPAYFDKILVDAPCSGEGMFRKNEGAIMEWSLENVKKCISRQRQILESAALMVRPGGRLVYSTCTFEVGEDEGMVSHFLKKHPEFYLEEVERYPGMEPGVPYVDIEGYKDEETAGAAGDVGIVRTAEKVIRLWPHKLKGEGHFLACLRKEGMPGEGAQDAFGWKNRSEKENPFSPRGNSDRKGKKSFSGRGQVCREWEDFCSIYLKKSFQGTYERFGGQLYLLPEGTPELRGLKVLRPGLHLGTLKKDRFEPAHALALSLKPEEAACRLELSPEEASAYLSGQVFPAEGDKGWYLITVGGYSLGWGKLSGGVMKNHYPRGLRS